MGICLLAGCERETQQAEGTADLPGDFDGDTAPGAQSNRLEGLPGIVYRSQAESPINWQPWTSESIELAKRSNRLMIVLIALPQQPSFAEILKNLESDRETVKMINDTYVPVLVDGDAIRELGILTADLCAEIGSGLQLPLMVWMTPDADPVAWIPLSSAQVDSVGELFAQSHVMVGRVWNDDPKYVSDNSKIDQGNRKRRIEERKRERELSVDPAKDAPRALRQLASLYDPVSRTFDEAGGLFPCGAIDLLSLGVRTEGLPESLREKSHLVLSYLLEDLLVSAMFDPLDGGVFSSRRGSTWALPGFYRDSVTQARVVVSLLNAYEVTGDKRAIERAMGIIKFVEAEYATPEGTFSLGNGRLGETENWLWRIEDVRKVLSEDELALWMPATGMKEMGNLPSEVDPQRQYFRTNSIGFVKSAEELSEGSGKATDEVAALLDSARRKLLKMRNERTEPSSTVRDGNAAATFRVASAYACAFRVTGDRAFLEKAEATLSKAREMFSRGPKLVLYSADAEASLLAGRAFLYGLAMQASIDLWSVTLDEKWLFWADDLATTTAELFASDGFVLECSSHASLIDLPITDLAMLFDESTAGLVSMAGARLLALKRPLLPALEEEALKLPMGAINTPILHTDLIQSCLVREYGVSYVYDSAITEKTREDLILSPLKGVSRRPAGGEIFPGVEMKSGGLLKIGFDGKVTPVDSVKDLPVPSLRNP